jgi:hypothetical protein
MEDSNILLRGLVLCIGLFVVLFYRLSYVKVVSPPLLHLALHLHRRPTKFINRLQRYTPQGMALLIPKIDSLLNPIASIVRLLTINSINAYITSWVLYFSGGSEDPRLLLPAWISIATVDAPLWLPFVKP